jgi:hypothetical protein
MIQWLLRNNPDLLGDLLEERASGRSRAWYWRQILVAVGRSILDEGRRHPFVTLRAAGLASAVYCAALAITLFMYGYLYGYLYPPMPESRLLFLFFSMEFVPALLAGWVLARTHRSCIEPAIVIILVLYGVLATPVHALELSTNVIGFLAGVWGGIRRHERPAQEGIS